jgi:hypothetical protein
VLITIKVNIWREIVEDGAGLAENDDVSGICRLLEKWSGLHDAQKLSMRDRARRCFLDHFEISNTSASLFNLFARQQPVDQKEAPLECVS